MKYVLDTKNGTGDLACFCDSYYLGDPDATFSTYMPAIKVQCNVTLSSTEAEWVSISEAIEEIISGLQFREGMQIMIKVPIIMRVDNFK